MELRNFNALLPAPQTEADWEEMPWLMGQGVGLVNDIRPAGEVVEQTMSEAQTILGRPGRSLSRSGDATSRRAMARPHVVHFPRLTTGVSTDATTGERQASLTLPEAICYRICAGCLDRFLGCCCPERD